ncbi:MULTISPECIES: ABC transporter permease [Anaerolinea]|uniref:ABC transporter permease n=1 Tax=Anaerolinea TaxID=233189 RepID=UPI00262AD11A|nr:ABC transporter permease [Anaerolinea thermophila]
MNIIWIVFRKEWVDHIRDQRAVVSALANGLFTPVFMLAMVLLLGKTMLSFNEENPEPLHVIGQQYAPALMQYLEASNIEIVPASGDLAEEVRQGKVKMGLILTEEYAQAFREGRPAPVQLVMDTSRQSNLLVMNRVIRLIETYSRQVTSLRLMARGIDPLILMPLIPNIQDVATPQSSALLFMSMLPFFIALVVFSAGAGVIVDSLVGERERNTLEPLLINPVRRSSLLIGKVLTSFSFAVMTVGLSLFVFWLGFQVLPIEESIGFSMTLSASSMFFIFLLCIPETAFAAVLQAFIASFARSYKEAQTFLAVLPFVVGIPSVVLAFVPNPTDLLQVAIPGFGHSILSNRLLRGEPVTSLEVIVLLLTTLLFTAVFLWLAIRSFQRERILASK